MAPLLREATDRLALAIEPRGFNPTETTRTFTIALSDNYQASEVPRIARAFAARMPLATLRVVSADYLAASDGLASGDVDITFSPEQAVQPGMRSAALFEEQASLIVRRDHPRVRTQMTRELFNELPHIDVHLVLGKPGTGHRVAQRGWERAQVRRRVVLTVPYFIIAAMAAADTDCVAALPSRMADLCVDLLPLKRVRATFPLPRVNTVMVWHQRTDEDPGAKLFREIILLGTRAR